MVKLKFKCKGSLFTIHFLHEYNNCRTYRVIDNLTSTWFLLKNCTDDTVKKEAIKKIKRVFRHGRPWFNAYKGRYIVKAESLSFRVGCHTKNPCGNSNTFAYNGEIITLESESDDFAFWYLDKGRQVDVEHYFKYTDGSPRSTVKGSKVWALLWEEQIKELK